MKKLIILVLSLALLTGCCVYTQGSVNTPTKTEQLVQHLQDSTVALVTTTEDGDYYTYCAGVWISPHKIITAKHCVEAMAPSYEVFGIEFPAPDLAGLVLKFRTRDEIDELKIPGIDNPQIHYAMVLAYDPNNDIAILSTVDDLKHDIAEISQDKIYDGLPVNIVGHTAGFAYTYMTGIVSKTRLLEDDGTYEKVLQITTSIYKGNSGGGAYDPEGKLIGICSSFNARVQSMSFFVHKDTIWELIQKENISLSN